MPAVFTFKIFIKVQLFKHKFAKYLCDDRWEQKLNLHQMHDCGHVLVKVPTTDLIRNKYGVKTCLRIFFNLQRTFCCLRGFRDYPTTDYCRSG